MPSIEMEDETLKTRATRRRIRVVQPSKIELIHESPEEKAAREAKLAAERTMRNAILLIQSHERARKGRCYGADGTRKNNYFFIITFLNTRVKKKIVLFIM